MRTRSTSRSSTPARPTAARMRPQLGSPANTAVLTRGDSATAKATRSASASLAAACTCTVIRRVAPSPSRAMAWASSVQRSVSAAPRARAAGDSGSERGGPPAAPVAASTQASLVEVSPSTVMRLNDTATASCSRRRASTGSSGASVATKASMVAMSGRIIPAPLAMPVRVTGTPSRSSRRVAPLGRVSVVRMAREARSQPSAVSPWNRLGTASTMRCSARGSPITPVEKGSTRSASQPPCCATARQQAIAACSPARPVPALALPVLIRR